MNFINIIKNNNNFNGKFYVNIAVTVAFFLLRYWKKIVLLTNLPTDSMFELWATFIFRKYTY